MPRISRDTIQQTFKSLAKDKEEAFLKKYPRPVVPTASEIVTALRREEFRVIARGSRPDTDWHGYVDRFRIEEMIKLPLIEAYRRKCARHRKRLDAFRAKVEIRRKEDFTYCMYGPGQVEQGAFYAKAQEFKNWRP